MTDELDENKVLVLSWVLKKSVKTHQWKKRWAVLRNCQLSYYENASEHKPSRVINKNDLLSFAKIPGHHEYHFAVYTSKKAYHFQVDSAELFDQWISALRAVILPSHHDDDSNDEGAALADEVPDLSELPKSKESREYLVEEGYLSVLKNKYSQWKKHYVLVSNRALYVCKSDDKNQQPEQVISVGRLLDVVEVDAKKGRPWCLMLIESKKTHYLSALSEQELAKFLLAIKAVILQFRAGGGREGQF